ncbi:3-keto-5-aminohexanoate cleavage protein [Gluconacetobacter takamatsuzukensis]|uniref:3-keto-5-aminohexanoate cleavage protein n=1 Tax=Gluconacetobacter takamatsuzukensis TaxID=1286190 RepID=A0A7W4KDM8_9PROT|nr:3-keto-5-aminohexanoate cleavage protein [Gluconacetobacter takamatsuzukensis]MBB2205007.1 3-keto-5-aminohexanoate cleavage protein [Gluconacetobacter takamatsuzukensis]
MIVQACLNGARPAGYHPRLPLTIEAMARDGLACIGAGAAELHVHPRGPDGRESLAAVDALMIAVRRICPGTLVGVSTGAWIEADETLTRERISGWRVLPDYASVNLSEPDAPAVMSLLQAMGVGVEAGLATVGDARRFVALPDCHRVFRVLIEIEEQNLDEADRVTEDMARVLQEARVACPVLLHGLDATVWHFVEQARRRCWSARVGLEDGCRRADGAVAGSNAELVADAARIFRRNASA